MIRETYSTKNFFKIIFDYDVSSSDFVKNCLRLQLSYLTSEILLEVKKKRIIYKRLYCKKTVSRHRKCRVVSEIFLQYCVYILYIS